MVSDEEQGPPAEELRGRLARLLEMLRAMAGERNGVAAWFASWLPLMGALQNLAVTAGKLLWRARQLADEEHDGSLLDDEALGELRERFAALVAAFPDASVFFFGIDNVDTLIGDVLADGDARGMVAQLAGAVDARLNEVFARLIEWGLEDGAPELSLQRLETFVRGLEKLLQEVLDRWVLPRLYDGLNE